MTHEQWVAMTRSGASTNSMATSAKDQKTLIDWGLASDQKTVTDATDRTGEHGPAAGAEQD